MHKLLDKIKLNLTKAEKGNKTAAQRTRTLTIQFAKCAKNFRKESVIAVKKGTMRKPSKGKKLVKKKPQKKVITSRKRKYRWK